jgi:pseudouridine-5'-phosphate glycosidase
MDVRPMVGTALQAGRPVVALESTVLTHGLPRPRNAEVGRRLEDVVRAAGAVPATIGVLRGRVCIGLSPEEIELLCASTVAVKASLRDLPLLAVRGAEGGTTVAATVWAAARAGIRVMATGGIGGVHRGAPEDVSADLPVLASTDALVVCAGPKAVLDLGRTREWLETHAVPVVGYGTGDMPAFWCRSSGFPTDDRADTPGRVAEIVRAQRALGRPCAVLLTVPVPEEHAVPRGDVERALAVAVRQAEAEGVRGAAVSPFLLERLAAATGGATLEANVALLENNAEVAARAAVALAQAPR